MMTDRNGKEVKTGARVRYRGGPDEAVVMGGRVLGGVEQVHLRIDHSGVTVVADAIDIELVANPPAEAPRPVLDKSWRVAIAVSRAGQCVMVGVRGASDAKLFMLVQEAMSMTSATAEIQTVHFASAVVNGPAYEEAEQELKG